MIFCVDLERRNEVSLSVLFLPRRKVLTQLLRELCDTRFNDATVTAFFIQHVRLLAPSQTNKSADSGLFNNFKEEVPSPLSDRVSSLSWSRLRDLVSASPTLQCGIPLIWLASWCTLSFPTTWRYYILPLHHSFPVRYKLNTVNGNVAIHPQQTSINVNAFCPYVAICTETRKYLVEHFMARK